MEPDAPSITGQHEHGPVTSIGAAPIRQVGKEGPGQHGVYLVPHVGTLYEHKQIRVRTALTCVHGRSGRPPLSPRLAHLSFHSDGILVGTWETAQGRPPGPDLLGGPPLRMPAAPGPIAL